MKDYAEKSLLNWKMFLIISLLFKTIKTTNSTVKIQSNTDDFQSLILNRNLYVDKTLLISEYLKLLPQDIAPLLIVQRPEGWTKSTNMKMLEKFLSIEVDSTGNLLSSDLTLNDKLFLGGSINGTMLNPLKISNSTFALHHLGQHPVILLQLESAIGTNYEDIIRGIRSCVMKAYKKHEYLSNSLKITDKVKFETYLGGEFSENELITSISFLSEKLYQHFDRKVHVLIDDYDIPFVFASMNMKNDTIDYADIETLLQNFLETSLTKNEYRSVALINAVYPVNMTWNHQCHMVDNSFIEYYGFTQTEVEKLLEDSKIQVDPLELKNWYGGYYVNGKNDHYNARSLMRCLARDGMLTYYGPPIKVERYECEIETHTYNYTNNQTIVDHYCESAFAVSAGKMVFKNVHRIFNILIESNLKSSQCSNSNTSLEYGSWSEAYLTEKSALLYNGFLTTYQNLVSISSDDSSSMSSQMCTEDLLALQQFQLEYLDYLIPNNEIDKFYHAIASYWINYLFGINRDEFYSFVQLIRNEQIFDFNAKLQHFVLNSRVSDHLQLQGTSELELYNAFMMSLKFVLSSSHMMKEDDNIESLTHCNISVYGNQMTFIPQSDQNDTIIIKFEIQNKQNQEIRLNRFNDIALSENKEMIDNLHKRSLSFLETNPNTNKLIEISFGFCRQNLIIEYSVASLEKAYSGICVVGKCTQVEAKYTNSHLSSLRVSRFFWGV